MRFTRSASLLASGAVAAAAVALGAPAANAAPADPDITGAVVNSSGTGLAGVYVAAFTTPADGSAPLYVDSVSTDATGHYSFNELDPASLAVNYPTNPAVTSETEFKLYYAWGPATPADTHSTGYLSRGLGGSKSVRAAGSVVVPSGAAATAPTQTLPTAGGVLLKVVGPTGAPVTGGYGDLYEPDAYDPLDAYVDTVGGYTSYDDSFYAPATAPVDGLVYIAGVEPGKSYAVNAYGEDYNATTSVYTSYVSRFYGGNGSYTKATAVPVTAGAFAPITVQLSDKLTPVESPRIIGNSSFGSTLKADPGTWLRQQGTDFTYQWLRGSTPVSTGPTYKLTKKDKGSKIRLVVTASNGTFVGTATTEPTSKVGEKSKVIVDKLGGGKFGVTVKVAKKKLAKKLGTPKGKVVLVTEDGQYASKKVKLKGGEATLKLRSKYAGEELLVLYLGGGKLGSDTAAVKGGKK